jgi:citrate synthase
MGRPADSNAADESLTVRDNRTGKTYNIPYVAISVFFDDAGVVCKVESEALRTGVYRIKDNTVSASAFKAIAAPLKPGERVENETPKGLRVSDKGFLNTAVIQSQITYIDGEAGILRYRGYPIEQLALHSTHLETAYLLIYGTLPGEKQLRMFENEVMSHTFVHADAENFFRSFRCALARSHPFAGSAFFGAKC